MSANLATANTALVNALIILRLVNVGRHQVQLNARGTVKPLILLVKNVVLLIVMKPAVITALTLAPMAVAENANAAHQPPPPAHLQVVQVLTERLHLQAVVQELMIANVGAKIITKIYPVLVIILIDQDRHTRILADIYVVYIVMMAVGL